MLHVTMDVPAERRAIRAAVEGLAEQNHVMMARRSFPRLYNTGILYRREDTGREDWQNAAKLLEALRGDCEDLAAYRVGELRAYEGEPARIEIVPTVRGSYHAVVRRASGELEDPSRWQIAREQEGYMMDAPKFTLRDNGAYWVAGVDFPYGKGRTNIEELGFDPISALKSVVTKAAKVLEAPEVQALLPPQVAIAFKTVHAMSNLSRGALRKLLEDDRSTDAQRALAKQLLKGAASGASSASSASPDGASADSKAPDQAPDATVVSPCQCPEPPTAAAVAGWVLGADVVRDHRDRTTGPGGKPKYPTSPFPPAARIEQGPPSGSAPATPVPTVDPLTGAQIDPRTGLPISQPGMYPPYPDPYAMYPQLPGYPYPQLPGYPYAGYPGMAVPFDPYNPYGMQAPAAPSVLMPEDMQALAIWGPGAFAPNAYSGVPGLQTMDQGFGYY